MSTAPTTAALDARFRAAGAKALREAPNAGLVANANCEDNFCLWGARTVEGGILDLVDVGCDDDVGWLNAYMAQYPILAHQRDDRPSRHPLVRAICAEVYAALRKEA